MGNLWNLKSDWKLYRLTHIDEGPFIVAHKIYMYSTEQFEMVHSNTYRAKPVLM